jgi:NAD(P)-dependent dehydrogenase (short-subunit alcohol dehydrogenase family)
MSRFNPDPFLFSALYSHVVVLTGGCNGVGAATVSLLHEHGALVVFGDRDEPAAAQLTESLGEGADFVRTNVTVYQEVLALFHFTHAKYGRVDHAFCIVAISEQEDWFHPSLTLASVASVRRFPPASPQHGRSVELTPPNSSVSSRQRLI